MNYLLKFKNSIIIILCGWIATGWAQQSEIQLAIEYWNKGEHQKSYETYRQLSRDAQHLQAIHSGYLTALLELKKYKEAHDQVERMIRRFSQDPAYALDQGYVYLKEGDLTKADKSFQETINEQAAAQFAIKNVADYFLSKGLPEYAEKTYLAGRAKTQVSDLFALELANVYRIRGKKREMVEEYLNYLTTTPGNSGYIRNLLQLFLTRPEDMEMFQQVLYERVQRNPDMEIYADLLIWSMIQQKDFQGALIQSKAYDRRFGHGVPNRSYELAQIATNNQDYPIALKAYAFIIQSFPNSDHYLPSRLGSLRATEAMVRGSNPVKRDSMKILMRQYRDFANQFSDDTNGLEARISEARIQAFYLDHLDSAVTTLGLLIDNPRAATVIRARAKLELGDIYLIKSEYWESTLLYSQVEKMQKDNPVGHEAKFRNAKLYYFKGDFKLAEEHLDVLKQATSREISNDAIDLSLRIKENTLPDTLGQALAVYAAAELLLQQNKSTDALSLLSILHSKTNEAAVPVGAAAEWLKGKGYQEANRTKDSVLFTLPEGFQTPTIRDDVYWLEAKIIRKQGQSEAAMKLLQRIVEEFPSDVLADDASFTIADIIEKDMRDPARAMPLYNDFLVKFPGSVYAAEARKRFRLLRGDFQATPPDPN